MVGVVVLSVYIIVLLLGVFCRHVANMSGFVRNDATLTQHLRSQNGPMSPTWSVLCRRHVADMLSCLSFWREKIPDTMPTLPAKSCCADFKSPVNYPHLRPLSSSHNKDVSLSTQAWFYVYSHKKSTVLNTRSVCRRGTLTWCYS